MERTIPFLIIFMLVLPFAVFSAATALSRGAWIVLGLLFLVFSSILLLIGAQRRGSFYGWIGEDHDPVVAGAIVLLTASVITIFCCIRAKKKLLSLRWDTELTQKSFERCCLKYLSTQGWKISNMRRTLGVRIVLCERGKERFSGIIFSTSIRFQRFSEALWGSGATAGGNYVVICASGVDATFINAGVERNLKIVSYTDLDIIGDIAQTDLISFRRQFAVTEQVMDRQIFTTNKAEVK